MSNEPIEDRSILTAPNAELAGLMAEVLAQGGTFRFQASGFSMFPFIRDGDNLTIAPTPARLHLGDVVAFIQPDNKRLLVHRIVQVSAQGYLTKGDNSTAADGTLSREFILGCVLWVERQGNPSRIGLGLGRGVIASLSLHGWLIPVLRRMRSVLHIFEKRSRP
jgi:hypothetical protein